METDVASLEIKNKTSANIGLCPIIVWIIIAKAVWLHLDIQNYKIRVYLTIYAKEVIWNMLRLKLVY